MLFTQIIRHLCEYCGQLQHKVAAGLNIDAGLHNMIERGERPAKREQAIAISPIFYTEEKVLFRLWFADEIIEIEPEQDIADNAMKIEK